MRNQASLMRNQASGFSLVELLISITIMGLILAIGTVGYRDFTRRENISGVAQLLVNDMRLAQQYALAGYKPAGCNATLVQYEYQRISATQYRIVAVCTPDEIVVKTVDLPSGITLDGFTPSIAGDSVGFRPVTMGTDLAAETTTAVRGNGTSFVQVIRLRPGGDIGYE